MKNPSLDYPRKIMLDEVAALERQVQSLPPSQFRDATEERLAACKLVARIVELYGQHQSVPLEDTGWVPPLG
jgi:hypothetical protein